MSTKTKDSLIAIIADGVRDDFIGEVHDLGLDSPIEEVFAAALLYCLKAYTRDQFFQISPPGDHTIEDCLALGHATSPLIWPQVKVGRYRIDFLVRHLGQTVIVECDGHEFHERTKEQAERDKGRDRYLQSRGLSVLHFTGAEIWRAPLAKAEEVLEFLRLRAVDAIAAVRRATTDASTHGH